VPLVSAGKQVSAPEASPSTDGVARGPRAGDEPCISQYVELPGASDRRWPSSALRFSRSLQFTRW
jgi:hypothetical protein